jgi:hypothetical protein
VSTTLTTLIIWQRGTPIDGCVFSGCFLQRLSVDVAAAAPPVLSLLSREFAIGIFAIS